MKIYSIVSGCIIFVLVMANISLASDDFQIRPPVFVLDKKDTKKKEVMKYFEPEQTQPSIGPSLPSPPYTPSNLFIRSPLFYFSLGIQTEATWFDRRLNWASYSTQLVVDTGKMGFRYQGSLSSAGRENFELFDSRLDIYAYWLPEEFEASEAGFARVGGGLSYFDCDAYQGQEFLKDQRFAAFASIYYIFVEFKFVMLIHDDFWNGGLVELKIFNPFLYLGLHAPDTAPKTSWIFIAINAFLPYEFGFTGSFGLPEGGDGWGWFIKGRYVILGTVFQQKQGHLSVGAEIYWSYKNGIGNTRVSESVEFGIKFTMIGF